MLCCLIYVPYYRQESLDLERTTLYSKQGRTTQFTTKAARDNYLKTEITDIKKTIEAQEGQIGVLEGELEEARARLGDVERGVEESRRRLEGRKSVLKEIDGEFTELREERNRLDEKRK